MIAHDHSSAGQHSELGELATMKILVIDDEPANVALLEELLAEAGYTRVEGITDSRIALENCRSFEPDLVLLDLMMPHVDGFAILEALRSTPAGLFLPVVVLTADVNEETKRRVLDAGASDFLLKPIDHHEVLLRIADQLETRRLHRPFDS